MRSILAAAVVALIVTLGSDVHAANFCASFGSVNPAQAEAVGLTLPAKGSCAAFNGFYRNRAGILLAGDVCRSSNGTTFLFNLFTQTSNGLTDTLTGTWSAATGRGLGRECFSTPCLSFSVAVTKCPANVTIPVPADISGFQAETSSPMTTDEPESSQSE